MTDREKLVGILENAGSMRQYPGTLARILIENGVVIPVRCKDCKYNEDCIHRIQFWGRNPVLELNTSEYHPLDFCSYGERRTE